MTPLGPTGFVKRREGPVYRVHLQPTFGVGLSCGSVEVVAIDRGCPEGSVSA